MKHLLSFYQKCASSCFQFFFNFIIFQESKAAIDVGMYTIGYRWPPYTDPVAVFFVHMFALFLWTWQFYHWFFDGDHHIPGNLPVIKPLFQGQLNRLFLNEELGLPSVNPIGTIVGAEVKKSLSFLGQILQHNKPRNLTWGEK